MPLRDPVVSGVASDAVTVGVEVLPVTPGDLQRAEPVRLEPLAALPRRCGDVPGNALVDGAVIVIAAVHVPGDGDMMRAGGVLQRLVPQSPGEIVYVRCRPLRGCLGRDGQVGRVMRRGGDGKDVRWFKGPERCATHVMGAFSEGERISVAFNVAVEERSAEAPGPEEASP